MEQKHLDEMPDNFQGEEFIDDADFEVKVEPAKARKAGQRGRPAKEAKLKMHSAEEKKVEKRAEARSEPARAETPVSTISSPTNPWQEERPERGFLADVSSWKFIAGMLLIALVFSVLTHGFRLGSNAPLLSSSDAEKTALDFVNTNFLQPPFVAQVAASEDVGDLFRVTLAVAGQEVDSYLTKDGKLFFPQGFDTSKSLLDQLEKGGAGEGVEDSSGEAQLGQGQVKAESAVEEIEPDEENQAGAASSAVEPVVEDVIIVPLQARKWFFAPNQVTVRRGETVQLSIVPQAVEFTFSIPELGIEEHVSGPTVIEFVADKAGEFEFLCSSCGEAQRGSMKGTLMVE